MKAKSESLLAVSHDVEPGVERHCTGVGVAAR